MILTLLLATVWIGAVGLTLCLACPLISPLILAIVALQRRDGGTHILRKKSNAVGATKHGGELCSIPSGELFYYGLYFNMFGLFLIFFQWNFFFRWKLRDKRKKMVAIFSLDPTVQPRERFCWYPEFPHSNCHRRQFRLDKRGDVLLLLHFSDIFAIIKPRACVLLLTCGY